MSKPESSIKIALDQAMWLTSTLPIRLYGDPALTTPCEPVTPGEIQTGKAKEWADQMISFQKAYREKTGIGRGLAANQLGIGKRIFLIWLDTGPEIYLNPVIDSTEGEGVYPESCISAASLLAGDVVRPWSATFSYTTLAGAPAVISPEPIYTRVMLHEFDHLDGQVCSDKYISGTIRLNSGDKDEILKPKLKRIN